MARRVVDEFIIPKCTGKAFTVKKGQVLCVIECEEKQVASVAVSNAHNYKERLSARHSVIVEKAKPKRSPISIRNPHGKMSC